MEALRNSLRPHRLTKLYAETKKSYENVTEAERMRVTSVSSSLQRKLRIQKDRLVTWGLDWSDASVSQTADIDDALNRAGLSEIVASVMSSIQELLDEAEKMRSPKHIKSPGSSSNDKGLENPTSQAQRADKAHFEDLLHDLTISIDTLFDLSRSRRGFDERMLLHATVSQPSVENLNPTNTPELPSAEVKRSSWSSPAHDYFHKSAAPVDSPSLGVLGQITSKGETMNGPPPPYEAVTSEPAISASLITLLQPTEDSLRVSVPNLEDRLRLAFNLAFSLNLLHQRGVNHGKITSGNVVILRCSETTSQGNYRSWRGYDIRNAKFLPADESGRFSAPVDLEPYPSNIYHHPQAGQASSIRRKQAHDIYSLGLVLLEIGFWMPLRAFWKTKYSQDVFKSRLENVYVKKLAAKCGSVYMRTVQHCLASVDSLIVQPFQVITPSQIQRHFHVKVVKLLERYSSVLDEPDSLPVSDLSALPQPPEGESVQTPPIAQKRRPQKCLSKRKVKVWSIPPPASVLDDWNHLLLPRLERIVNRTLKNSAESFSADLMMVGENSVTLRPMIMVTCTSVLEIKTAIHRHLKHNRETYDLRVRRGEICRSKVSRKRKRHQPYRSAKPSATEMSTTQEPATLPSYQQQPACGASIGAFRDNEHLPPVSFGGVILLDDELYGMTVHHMLEQSSVDEDSYSEEDENEDPVWSNATSGSDSLFPETFPAHSSYGQNLPQALYQLEISDDEDDGYSSAADDDDGSWIFEEPEIDEQVGLDDDDVSLGDSPGIDPNEDDAGDCLITQPAIDDVDDAFFPIEDDRDEEHLASHFLGNIHASSGIRRWKRNGLKHEIDWALIKLIDSRAQHYNIIKGGGRYCGGKESGVSALEDFCPHRVASVDELAGLPVHCLGRTSGLQGGTISSAMSLVKFHGRSSPSLSWHVVGNFGVGGDSGAWVIDNRHGRVCGHVLAWCSKSCVAYIAPMEVLLEDITQTLQASRVALPCPRRLARTEAPAQSGRYDLTKTRIAMAVDKPLPAIPMSSLPLNWDAVDSTGSSQYTLVETASVTEPGSTDDIEHMQEPVGGRYKLESENDKKLRGGNIPMSSGPPSTPLVIASGKARAC